MGGFDGELELTEDAAVRRHYGRKGSSRIGLGAKLKVKIKPVLAPSVTEPDSSNVYRSLLDWLTNPATIESSISTHSDRLCKAFQSKGSGSVLMDKRPHFTIHPENLSKIAWDS